MFEMAHRFVDSPDRPGEAAEQPSRRALDDHADPPPRHHPILQLGERAVDGLGTRRVPEAHARLGQVPEVRSEAPEDGAVRRELLEHAPRLVHIPEARELERPHDDLHDGVVRKLRR
jgi:hypothetical protein